MAWFQSTLENVVTTTFEQRTSINLRKCRNYYFQTKNLNQS
ncbi:hypothetical protein LEP1GSC045_3881 [Leptospira interrogans serovar Pomona str. Kennewicki LC82-25]|nr:hypothetical protein LEP1GSC045_3881 [Leptospira interrogans serovar Pomona str. Kennewicki LC82-25]EKN98012.1 hypothetical protein LEP1GSC014_2499 [Leptospira interrogans serovar Pomona str. Pomona]EKO70392.1 hypothetical protein LEP1GSC069_2096 [Leptospira interrogans serovar Canicola str. Fiocruz LV133]EMF31799.1 hypothetical protein LEP1GSC201_3864 [Leptospira interrogans serovar Pomona str. Fox 32256]EMN77387.1 hypothetical protein LEP1GSC102_3211 [Leptospira interrogans str. UI 09600]